MIQTILFAAFIAGAFAAPSRVVNGTDADPGEFPYIISLRSASGSHSCGGSIINKNWILTAAHCVLGKSPSSVSVQYGSNKISSTGGNIAKVSQIIIHKDYDSYELYADIAVLKLTSPLTFSSEVQPTKLPAQDQEVAGGSVAILSGWGLDQTGGSIQTNLQRVELTVYSHDDCSKAHYNTIFKSNVCAGVPEGGKGQCSGDSGGPLALKDGTQIGLVSWSVKPCTVKGYPGVFTRVASFRDWINENIE